MLTKQIFKFTALAIAASCVLAACGGGGGGGSNNTSAPTGASSPSSSTGAIALVTSVPTPTYGTTSMQATAFQTLNAYRLAAGVGEVAQDPILDTAAQAHALYLDSNLANGNLTALSHDEVPPFANFFSDTPLSRAQKAGAPVTEFIGEDVGAGVPQTSQAAYGTSCINIFTDSVYHLQATLSVQQTMGIGFQQNFDTYPNFTCVLDFGVTAGVSGTPPANEIFLSGGQQMANTAIAHVPLANEVNVPLAISPEAPNAAPDVATLGRPIMVMVNAPNPGDVLTVSNFTLTSTSGPAVPTRIVVPSAALTGSAANVTADVNNAMFPGVAFLLPLIPLTANTTYTISFSGARDGSPISTTWSFTTAAAN
jgi:hypothetical protein